MSYAADGNKCLMWSSMHQYIENSSLQEISTHSELSTSYCRNPSNDDLGPWCYVRALQRKTSTPAFTSSSSTLSPSSSSAPKPSSLLSQTSIQTQYCGIPVCGAPDYYNNLYVSNPQKSITKTTACIYTYNIQLIVFPLILIIGTIMNTLSFRVFQSPALNKSTTSLLLRLLAITDTTSLYFTLFTKWLRLLTGLFLESSTTISCGIYIYFNYLSVYMSNWIIVFITIVRLLAVSKPHKAKLLCTKKNVCIAVITIFIFFCPALTPSLIGFEPKYFFIFDTDDVKFVFFGRCYICCYMKNDLPRIMIPFIGNVIPFLSILCGNITILVNIVRNRRTRRALTSMNIAHSENQFQSLTTSLLLVSVIYLIFTFPQAAFFAVAPTMKHIYNSYSEYWCSKELALASVQCALCINYSLNFILYCIGTYL